MKLIVDIDEKLYEAYKGKPPMLGDEGMDMIAQAIANGIPVSSDDDLISRSDLKQAINKVVDEEIGIDEKWAIGLKYSIKIIENVPTVEFGGNNE